MKLPNLKVFKQVLLILIAISLIILQVHENNSSYIYIAYILVFMIIFYFDDIKRITFGSSGNFEIEKFEKLSNKLDFQIVSIYLSLMKISIAQRKSFFEGESPVHENYHDYIEIVEDIKKLPLELRSLLNDGVKENSNKLASMVLQRVSKGN